MTFVLHFLGVELLRFSMCPLDEDSEPEEEVSIGLPFGFATEDDYGDA